MMLALDVSPFWKPYCRIPDAQEMKDFGLGAIPAKCHAAAGLRMHLTIGFETSPSLSFVPKRLRPHPRNVG